MLSRSRLILLTAMVLLRAGQAFAQQAEPPAQARDLEAVIASAEYKDLVKEGMLKYTRGFWPEARAYFLKAHELAPNARTLRGLALVSYDSRHYVDAIDYAEQSLAHPFQPLNEKMGEELKQLVQQAQNLITRAEIVTSPANAELRVDGALVNRRADGTVWIDPGDHELAVSAPEFWSESRKLQLNTEKQVRFDIPLKPRTVAAAASVQAPVAKPQPEERSVLPWVVTGASVLVAAGGGIMLAADRGESASTPVGGALLGVGAVGVIVGLTWSLWPRTETERSASARLHVSPLAIQCSGSF